MEAILFAIAFLLSSIWGDMKKGFESVADFFSKAWDRLVDIKEAVVGAIKYSITWIKKLVTDTVDFCLWVYNLVIDFFPWLWKLLKACFKALLNFLSDFLSYIVEKVMDFVISLLNNIPGLDSLTQLSNYYSSLPSEILSMMTLIGIPEATEIIIIAIGIRIILQLIPFTRLGS